MLRGFRGFRGFSLIIKNRVKLTFSFTRFFYIENAIHFYRKLCIDLVVTQRFTKVCTKFRKEMRLKSCSLLAVGCWLKIHFTLYTLHFTLYILHFTMYIAKHLVSTAISKRFAMRLPWCILLSNLKRRWLCLYLRKLQ